MLKRIALAGTISLFATGAWAGCALENQTPIKMLSAGFAAWKAASGAMAECGNFEAELDQEFRHKQPAALEANPALYQIGGVSNGTLVPLMNQGTIRPLDDLVAKHGQHLRPNQLIRIDGQTMAIAMMVNTQHLMYREDILNDLGIAVPTTYDEVLAAAETIRQAGVVEYPLGGTLKTGWNIAQEFVNMHLGMGGAFIDSENRPTINNEMGLAALEMMKRLTAYMDPEYLVSDSTYVPAAVPAGQDRDREPVGEPRGRDGRRGREPGRRSGQDGFRSRRHRRQPTRLHAVVGTAWCSRRTCRTRWPKRRSGSRWKGSTARWSRRTTTSRCG